MDFTKIQMSSKASSNKVWKQDVGSFSVPNLGGAGVTYGRAVIPHGFGSDGLIAQVAATTALDGTGDRTYMPWESNDGRLIMFCYVDATNLYIVARHEDSSGYGYPAQTVNFSYRLLIP